MRKIKVSAFLVVRNEEKNIERCLKSLNFCDEIIIVDQESSDNTIAIAKKYTSKIYHDKCWGYADPSRKLGASKCKGEWILNVDADEEITPELRQEIQKKIQNSAFDAYHIHRKFFYLGTFLKHLGQHDFVLRLHRKNVCVVPKKKTSIGVLIHSMNHYAYTSWNQIIERAHRYAKIQAKTDTKYHTFPRNPFGVIYLPLAYFFYDLIYKKGFLDGPKGILYSIINAYYQILIFRYMWFS